MKNQEMQKWNPFKEMEEVHNRLSSFLGLPLNMRFGKETEADGVSGWSPLVDITEDDKEYLIKAELPDIKREDVQVTVENNVLTIAGERKLEKEEKNRRYHRIERAYGNFTRSFTLPEDADASKVNAQFKDGLLTVHVTKSEQAKPKSIEVKVG